MNWEDESFLRKIMRMNGYMLDAKQGCVLAYDIHKIAENHNKDDRSAIEKFHLILCDGLDENDALFLLNVKLA